MWSTPGKARRKKIRRTEIIHLTRKKRKSYPGRDFYFINEDISLIIGSSFNLLLPSTVFFFSFLPFYIYIKELSDLLRFIERIIIYREPDQEERTRAYRSETPQNEESRQDPSKSTKDIEEDKMRTDRDNASKSLAEKERAIKTLLESDDVVPPGTESEAIQNIVDKQNQERALMRDREDRECRESKERSELSPVRKRSYDRSRESSYKRNSSSSSSRSRSPSRKSSNRKRSSSRTNSDRRSPQISSPDRRRSPYKRSSRERKSTTDRYSAERHRRRVGTYDR